MQFAKKAKSKRVCFDTNVAVEKSLLSKATKIIRKRKLHFGEKDDTDNRAMDAHEEYQVNVFNVVMDQIVTSSNSRFENYKDFTKIFHVWTLANSMIAEDMQRLPQNALESLYEKIGNHVNPIHAAVCRNKSCRSCFNCDLKRFYEYGLNLSTYSEQYAAYQYLVPLSVTQVGCERSFLTLKFILRSNIGQEKLETLMLTYMHKQPSRHTTSFRRRFIKK